VNSGREAGGMRQRGRGGTHPYPSSDHSGQRQYHPASPNMDVEHRRL
jgi:hypothetical protein